MVLWAAAVLLLAFALQTLVWGTNSDTSWLITVIEKMRSGERLYRDIIELNPPFSIWLYYLPVSLSGVLPASPEVLVRAYVLLICLGGVTLLTWLLCESRLVAPGALGPLFSVLLLIVTVLSATTFSQRDQIGAILILPLLVLAAWRSASDRLPPRPVHWLAAGGAGGIIALVKPHYALIVITAAAWTAVQRRDWRAFFLPEFLIAAAMSAAYASISYVAYPVFFTDLLPLLSETYMAFAWPFPVLASSALPWVGLPVAWLLLHRRGAGDPLANLLLLAAGVAWIPYFMQGKGWAYHAYPATLLASAAVAVALVGRVAGKPEERISRHSAKMLLAVVAVVAAHAKFLPAGGPSGRLADEVLDQVTSPTVGILGGDIASGHPLARMIGGRWIEPYCSDWVAVYALRLERQATAAGDAGRAARYIEMLDRYLAGKLERLTDTPPDILIVKQDGRLVRMMLAEHGFAGLLSRYSKIAGDGELEIYRRRAPASS